SRAGTRGSAYVTDTIAIGGASIKLRRHVLAFFQGNRYLLDALAGHVANEMPAGSDVLDLYAGVGLFAASIAAVSSRGITAVEGDRVAAADLSANAVPAGGQIVAVHDSVERFTARYRQAADGHVTVILDPPRTGVSREALEGICRLRASRIVYVSCDVA